ncbi:MAG: hypothetical protein IKU44_03035 [Firmicutes bacterium]|nr:hypothetical protein [Bacillota bacterium]
MAKLIDYHCRYADYSGMSKDDAAAKGLSLPEAYCIAEQIALLAGPQAVLPFDPIVEAEAMGAKVKMDDSPLGPRKDEDIVTSIEQLLDLTPMNFEEGRLAETLKALKIINDNGGEATFEIQGPVTIINGVADIMKVLIGWRKKADVMEQFFGRLVEDLVELAVRVNQCGCKIIYYTDSPGSLDILGPKYAKQITEGFTVPFLKAIDEKLPADCVIHLCPKTSFLLAGCEKAQWKKLHFDQPIPYKTACEAACGKVRVLGQRCRKAADIQVSCINYLELE